MQIKFLENSNVKFFGLLFISPENSKFENVKTNDGISVYIKNAILLAKSLEVRGARLCLLTNNKDFIVNSIESNISCIEIIQIEFSLNIPSGTRFYSAHFKLDVFDYFSKLDVKYCGLLDLDVVCVNPLNKFFTSEIQCGTPLVYDITDQLVQAYGNEVIKDDLVNCVQNDITDPRWYGGEFIFGTPSFFNTLKEEIDIILPNYFKSIGLMNHVGDEAVTSAALNVMKEKGFPFKVINGSNTICRFWRLRPKHKQVSLAVAFEHTFIHLPSDKLFLAAHIETSVDDFKKNYVQYYWSFSNVIANSVRFLKNIYR
jgi:hypothetical protein